MYNCTSMLDTSPSHCQRMGNPWQTAWKLCLCQGHQYSYSDKAGKQKMNEQVRKGTVQHGKLFNQWGRGEGIYKQLSNSAGPANKQYKLTEIAQLQNVHLDPWQETWDAWYMYHIYKWCNTENRTILGTSSRGRTLILSARWKYHAKQWQIPASSSCQ